METRAKVRLIFSILGLIGIVSMLFGVIAWNVAARFAHPLAYLPVLSGAALFVVFLAVNIPIIILEARRQRTLVGINVFAMVVIAVFLLVLVNYLAFRHYKRFDVTSTKIYSLSDLTKKQLANLKDDITVYVFYTSADLGYQHVKEGLEKYQEATDRIKVDFVDVERDISSIDALKAKIGSVQRKSVVFYAEKSGNSKFVKESDIFDIETSGMFGSSQRIKAYNGEEAFTAAIINVTAEKQFKIYFVKGHGEKNVEKFGAADYGPVVDDLKRLNYRVDTVNLIVDEEIPADCDVLVIAGPQQSFTSSEAAMIDKYLAGGGRVLAMLDPVFQRDLNDSTIDFADIGLEDVLEKYGIRLSKDIVLDPRNGAGVVCVDYTWQDIVRSLKEGEYPVLLPTVRSVNWTEAKDRSIKTSGLITTPSDAWAEESAQSLAKEAPRYDKGEDTGGPITVASAAWKEGKGGMRLVVIGDSDFVTRDYAAFMRSNQNLFDNCVNWLAEQMDLIDIAPKTIQTVRVSATPSQQRAVLFIVILGIPLLVVVAGGIVFFLRRR